MIESLTEYEKGWFGHFSNKYYVIGGSGIYYRVEANGYFWETYQSNNKHGIDTFSSFKVALGVADDAMKEFGERRVFICHPTPESQYNKHGVVYAYRMLPGPVVCTITRGGSILREKRGWQGD